MPHTVHQTEALRAWIEPPPFRELDLQGKDDPDLRLLVISEERDVLLVEVLEGAPCPSGTMLWVEDRGSFEVAVVLSRACAGHSRCYMKLRDSGLPAAA